MTKDIPLYKVRTGEGKYWTCPHVVARQSITFTGRTYHCGCALFARLTDGRIECNQCGAKYDLRDGTLEEVGVGNAIR